MANLSIAPGFIRQSRHLDHGALAASIGSMLDKRFSAGNDKPLTLSEIATATASKLEEVVAVFEQLESKGLLAKNVDGNWSGVSSIVPYAVQIKVAVTQKDLFGSGEGAPTPRNPLGLFLGHDYRRSDGDGSMTFRGYQPDDGVGSPGTELEFAL